MVPDIIKQAARDLRNNSTKSEVILWNYLKGKQLGIKFLRQYPLFVFTDANGLDRYIIPDFYCMEKKLILEIDGNVHDNKDVYLLDIEKEKIIKQRGLDILRIRNEDVLNNLKETIKIIKTKIT